MNNKIVKAAFLLLLPVLAAVLFACAQTATIAAWHPVEVTAPPLCSDCHNDDRAAMNHTPDFSIRHKFYAAQADLRGLPQRILLFRLPRP